MKPALRILTIAFLVVLIASTAPPSALCASTLRFAGVNLAGAEFGEGSLPGTYGVDYIYPTSGEVDYFYGKGMNLIRLPFRWERLQRAQFETLDGEELARLDAFVDYATGRGASVILDPHNSARYYGEVIGSAAVPASAFADFWGKVAAHFAGNERVLFGLMNEPHDMPTEQWRAAANAAISAIRGAGAANLVLVPGNGWSGAFSWYDSWYGTPNAVEMLQIVDPGANYAFEVHQYLDPDSSGSCDEQCVSPTIGAERLVAFTGWLREHGKRGFLGEFAGIDTATCHSALDGMLQYVSERPDAWLGWAYWAAGPWWGDYCFSVEPLDRADRPQMAILEPYLFPRYRVYVPAVALVE